ncbi:MAG: TPM domain-containing protein, partial [Parcubacteria group bacterium]|nr:TPM domain-containing protein [Parcubacteria group bacterium]
MRLGLLATIGLAIPLAAAAYVSPGSPQGLVNDFAGVLSAAQEVQLETLLSEYERQTGNEIAVAIVNTVGDETVETYAVRLFEEWGIGKEEQDNGALFVVAVSDRVMRIETGYGLEGDLTDAEAAHLVDTVVPPYFAASDFDGGVRAGVVGMLQAVGADVAVGAAVSESRGNGSFISEFFWVFIFIFIWLASVFARSRS